MKRCLGAFLILAILLIPCGTSAVQKWIVITGLTSSAEVDMHEAGNAWTVSARLNGAPVEMLIDTGSGATLISPEIASEIKAIISESSWIAHTPKGQMRVQTGIVNSLQIGGYTLAPLEIGVIPLGRFKAVLGNDVLRHFVITLDPKRKKFRLERFVPNQ